MAFGIKSEPRSPIPSSRQGWETTGFLGGVILLLLSVLTGIFILRLPATPGGPDSQLTKMFAETIFRGDPKVNLEQLISAGLDEHFFTRMVFSLQPDGSALVFFIPRSNLSDERQLLDSLYTHEGKLHKTNFSNRL